MIFERINKMEPEKIYLTRGSRNGLEGEDYSSFLLEKKAAQIERSFV
jgi:hypothetical protein